MSRNFLLVISLLTLLLSLTFILPKFFPDKDFANPLTLYPENTKTKGTYDVQNTHPNQLQIVSEPLSKKSVLPQTIQSTSKLYVLLTFYGFADNDPPGKNIAYTQKWYSQTIHNQAGGTGTFADPVTFAAKEGRFPIGMKFYVPFLKKYIILEDICASCQTDHIDVWMESDGKFPDKLEACQKQWTRWVGNEIEVEIDPPASRIVNTTSFYNLQNGTCHQP